MSSIKRRFVLCANLRPRAGAGWAPGEDLGQVPEAEICQLADEVTETGGQVAKALPRGLLVTFPQGSQALAWVLRCKEAWAAHALWQLQAAIAVGEVVEWGGDCFGEAVNIATKMLEVAGPGQNLISDEVFAGLPREAQVWFREQAPVTLASRQRPIGVYLLADEADGTTVAPQTMSPQTVHPTGACGIRLEFEDRELVFSNDQLPVSFGRSSRCVVPVENARVSRTHARIDLTRAGLELTDLSGNGTYVGYDGSPHVVALRRGFCVLQGTGTISLGAPPDNRRASAFRFAVLMAPKPSL